MFRVFRPRCLWVALACLVPPVVCAGPGDDPYSMRGVSSHWSPQEWTVTIRYADMGGVPEQPGSHIRWARLHGTVRDAPLAPAMNPLAAAEAILQSRRFKALDQYSREAATGAIRSQALAMVNGLIPPRDEQKGVDDEQWKSCVKQAADAGIRWDGKREEFVTGLNP